MAGDAPQISDSVDPVDETADVQRTMRGDGAEDQEVRDPFFAPSIEETRVGPSAVYHRSQACPCRSRLAES